MRLGNVNSNSIGDGCMRDVNMDEEGFGAVKVVVHEAERLRVGGSKRCSVHGVRIWGRTRGCQEM